jgi:hypothetical protein
MTDWWNRPTAGEGWEFLMDVDTGRGGWHYREHLWLAPLRGTLDLIRDLRAAKLGFRHWFVVGALLAVIERLGS